tara:strand:- start:19264 stop:20811 length:1548 start_codon:yes stop_codon:yes gene_type:complete
MVSPYIYNLAQQFDKIAESSPDRSALIYPNGVVTSYRELQDLSLRAALLLQGRGVGRHDVVALLHDKSPSAFAIMLACLRLGAIYTNLDPASPPERARRMLQTCRPTLLVDLFEAGRNRELIDHLELDTTRETIHLGDKLASMKMGDGEAEVLERGFGVFTSADPAYIMFTSGSTGYPKGAVISHGSLLHFIDWARDRFEITPEDVFSNANPIYFDNSVFDFYASLFNGAALVPIGTEVAKDPKQLVTAIGRSRCTIWFSVPSLLVYLLTTRALSQDDFPSVRKIIFGGEGFPKPKLKQLFELYADRADLENVYGPTEGTCICSAHTISSADLDDMKNLAMLGYLAPNFGYEILATGDDSNVGELFLTGPQIALGYYHDPERTANAFVQNPSHNLFRDIGYRTGDLVERDPQGHLHFKGRVDFQIKHMGYRIELEEIEAALNALDGVNEAAAVYKKLGEGMGMILGFVALSRERCTEELLEEASRYLPPYMMPKTISILEQLPKNANGKIDRQAL